MKILTVLALTLCLSTHAVTGGHNEKNTGDQSAYMNKLVKKLDLTEDQASALKASHANYKAEKKVLREQYRSEIREILNKEQLEKYLRMKEKHRNKKEEK